MSSNTVPPADPTAIPAIRPGDGELLESGGAEAEVEVIGGGSSVLVAGCFSTEGDEVPQVDSSAFPELVAETVTLVDESDAGAEVNGAEEEVKADEVEVVCGT